MDTGMGVPSPGGAGGEEWAESNIQDREGERDLSAAACVENGGGIG